MLCDVKYLCSILLLGLVFSCFGVGCGTSHGQQDLSSSVTIHTFTREYSNVHVVVAPGGMFMVDAGEELEAEALAADMRDEGLDPSQIKAVILTHGHADHAGGAAYFAETFGTTVVLGKGDHSMISTGHSGKLCPTGTIARSRHEEDSSLTYTPFKADQFIEEGEELSLEELTGVKARVVSLPGHTPGSLVVLVEDRALVGDLFRGSIVGSGAEVHFYMCDLEDNRADIQSLLYEVTPEVTVFLPGHFGPVAREGVIKAFGKPVP